MSTRRGVLRAAVVIAVGGLLPHFTARPARACGCCLAWCAAFPGGRGEHDCSEAGSIKSEATGLIRSITGNAAGPRVDFMGLLVCAEIFVDGEPYTWNAATQHYDHVNGNEFVLFVTDDPAPPIPIDDPNVVVYYQLISGLDVVDQGRVV